MYDDRLVTFPGVGGPPAVTHVLVNRLPESDGQEDSAGAEVERVVELVLKHAAEHPDKSLGVITMGIKHAMRVQGALDLAQAKRPNLAEFFDPGRRDRFFIKNLERVQGDERDCIILSVGYGKDRAGNLQLRFWANPCREADGATYHSSYTARDRDRLRQQMLENLGWTFHRIWSTDWFQRKNEEIDRAVAAYERAVARANEPQPQQTIAPALEIVPELPLEELSAKRSSIFPPIPKRASIGDYTTGELQALYTGSRPMGDCARMMRLHTRCQGSTFCPSRFED